jgi:23S rRNA (uracil1939-C5)-methyltransferase
MRIDDVAYGGEGVGRHEGIVYFVPGVIPGETVEVEVVRVRKNYGQARVCSVVDPSPERVVPRCRFFGRCGGCAYQHVSYRKQLEWKARQVREIYRRIGGVSDVEIFPVVPSPLEWTYRNRVRIHVREGRVGFFQRGGHRVVEVDRCEIATACVNERLRGFRKNPSQDRDLTLAERSGVFHFEQTNDAVGELLCALLNECLPQEAHVLIDAYAGAGFFGRRLAGRFERVVGIEVHPGAVEAARAVAGDREVYRCGDVESLLPLELEGLNPKNVVLLVDPPASGLTPGVVETIRSARPRFISYVSCDVATQARDVKALLAAGYELKWLRPLDMFPQTADIEVVAFLELPWVE